MPSSLMARLKASQGAPAQAGGGGSSRSNVVTPPPPATATTSSLGSSLAAAAAGRTYKAPTKPSSTSAYVPQFKRNPLNATAAVAPAESTATAKNETSTAKPCEAVATEKRDKHVTVTSTTTPSPVSVPPIPTKTLIQQLLQDHKEPKLIPPPYYMCSESEASDRQQHLELHPLECNPETLRKDGGIISTTSNYPSNHDVGAADDRSDRFSQFSMDNVSSPAPQKASRHRPTFNPQCVVKKYRRSAAGGGTLSEASENCPRTLDQLDKTVDYLLERILVRQMMPPPADLDDRVVVDTRDSNNNADDPNEISIWGGNNEDPNEISLCGDDHTPVKSKPSQQQNQPEYSPFSLCDTVAFIDDRLRAVQKDLVTLLGNSEEPNNNMFSDSNSNSISAKRQLLKQQRTKRTVREMQAKMVRYNILASYLLSDVPSSKYEVKFGARALRTSLTCYLNLSTTLHEEYGSGISNDTTKQQYEKECQIQDEIMAYMALLHSSAVLRAEETALPPPTSAEITSSLMEDSGSGWGAVLSTFCKHVLHERDNVTDGSARDKTSIVAKYPRWKWALDLACAAQEGNYQRYFSLLEHGPTMIPPAASANTKNHEIVEADNARFLIMARCCTSHSLNLIRLAQLRRYNHAFGKGEKVSTRDLAKMLRLGNDEDDETMRAKSVVDFCIVAGLPFVEKEDNRFFVTMKSAPIKVAGDEAIRKICHPGRMNDFFVFESKLGCGDDGVESLANQLSQQCDIGEDVEDWEERGYDDDSKKKHPIEATSGVNIIETMARNDEDGVLIPPSDVLRNLIE